MAPTKTRSTEEHEEAAARPGLADAIQRLRLRQAEIAAARREAPQKPPALPLEAMLEDAVIVIEREWRALMRGTERPTRLVPVRLSPSSLPPAYSLAVADVGQLLVKCTGPAALNLEQRLLWAPGSVKQRMVEARTEQDIVDRLRVALIDLVLEGTDL